MGKNGERAKKALGLGFKINGRVGLKFCAPKRLAFRRGNTLLETTSDKSFRIKLTPNRYRKQRMHDFVGKKLLDVECMMEDMLSAVGADMKWLTSMLYDVNPDVRNLVRRCYEAEENYDEYEIKDDQYCIVKMAFKSAWACSKGMFLHNSTGWYKHRLFI